MLTAFGRAFKTPDLRKKLLFTLGDHRRSSGSAPLVPTPGVSYTAVQDCQSQGRPATSGVLGLANLFSGGALLQLSVFALGIMPYITASIIVQLLTVVIPRFEALKKEGQSGHDQADAVHPLPDHRSRGPAVGDAHHLRAQPGAAVRRPRCTTHHARPSLPTILIMVLTMTAGTGVIMWLGELITDRGIGNGMSLLIFTSIAARFPSSLWAIQQQQRRWDDLHPASSCSASSSSALVVFVEQSQRRVPVQYAKRMVGRRMYGGTSTYIPLKVNMAGVIPVIFASSLLSLPALLAQFNQRHDGDPPRLGRRGSTRTSSAATTRSTCSLYVALILFFTFFYVSITFNPTEVADNMKKYGGFIPGIRAGRPTAEYLDYVLTRITVPGRALPRAHLAHPAHRARRCRRRPELPVRRHLDPDHRRCRPGDREADRGPAAAAPLRRVPPLMRLHHPRPARRGQGHPGRPLAEQLRHPRHLHRRHLPRATSRTDRRSGSQVKEILASGGYVRDEITNAIVRTGCAAGRRAPGFLLDGYPRTMAQVEALDGMLAAHGPRARRACSS